MEEIEAGESRDGMVFNRSLEMSERTTEILVAGGDPHFILQKGIKCDIKWMLHTKKKEMYQLLDTTSYLRTDYQSFAQFLQIKDSTLRGIERESSRTRGSCTEALIRHWTETTGKTMTFGLLYNVLIHPGLVGNEKAARVIEKMMMDLGCQVCRYTVSQSLSKVLQQMLSVKHCFRTMVTIIFRVFYIGVIHCHRFQKYQCR